MASKNIEIGKKMIELLHRIDIDVIVAATVHLRKSDFLCHIAYYLGILLSFCYFFGCKGKQKDRNAKERHSFLYLYLTKKCHFVKNSTTNPIILLTPCHFVP